MPPRTSKVKRAGIAKLDFVGNSHHHPAPRKKKARRDSGPFFRKPKRDWIRSGLD
ncbi:MAG: hypothetical protein V3V15_03615 [Sphingorhabdus sp.]